jgi:hypothetical protein
MLVSDAEAVQEANEWESQREVYLSFSDFNKIVAGCPA